MLKYTNFLFFSPFDSALPQSFPLELGVFFREYGTGLYRADAYYLAKTIAEVKLVEVLSFTEALRVLIYCFDKIVFNSEEILKFKCLCPKHTLKGENNLLW